MLWIQGIHILREVIAKNELPLITIGDIMSTLNKAVVSEVQLSTIEKDLRKGNFKSFTGTLGGLAKGKETIMKTLKVVFPTISKVSKVVKEVQALSQIEDSYLSDYIGERVSTHQVNGESLFNYWYQEDSGDWITVEKQRFNDLKRNKKNRTENRLLNLTDSEVTMVNDKPRFTGAKQYVRGSDFGNVAKWKTLEKTHLLNELGIFHNNAKSWIVSPMKEIYTFLDTGVIKAKSTREDYGNKGESMYIGIAKMVKTLKEKIDGTQEPTAEVAPDTIKSLEQALNYLEEVCSSKKFKKELKKLTK